LRLVVYPVLESRTIGDGLASLTYEVVREAA
jgi:hypothetical protein